MKFVKYLQLEAVPEWRDKYINYKSLKRLLAQVNDRLDDELVLDRFHKPVVPSFSTETPQLVVPQIEVVCSTEDVTEFHSSNLVATTGSLREAFGGFWNSQLNWLHTTRSSNITPAEAEISLQQMLECCPGKEHEFFRTLDTEVSKVCEFYQGQLNIAVNRYKLLLQQVKLLQRHHLRSVTGSGALGLPLIRTLTDKAQSVKNGTTRFWRKLVGQDSAPPQDPFYLQPRQSAYSTLSVDDDTQNTAGNDDDEQDDEQAEKHREDQVFAEVQVSSNLARKKLKAAVKEFYRGLLLLENFKTLNRIGIGLILNKFDNAAKWEASKLYNVKIANTAIFASDSLEEIKKATESLFIHGFSDVDRQRGIQELRLPGCTPHLQGSFGRFGLYVGLGIPVLIQGVLQATKQSEDSFVVLHIFGALFLPLLLAMLFGLNAYIWRCNRVNYRFVFELNPRDNLEIHKFLEIPGLFFVLFSYCVYFAFNSPVISSEWFPLIFLLLVITLLFLPLNLFYSSARRWFSVSLWRILTSGLQNVHYRDFYLAEQLCSLTYSFGTIALAICSYQFQWMSLSKRCSFYGYWLTHLLVIIPYYWRWAQSMHRYLRTKANYQFGNVIKFTLASLRYVAGGVYYVTSNEAAFVCWVLFATLHTVYATTWDLVIDWGLFRSDGSSPLLRKTLLYKPWCYYLGMVLNVAIRLSWLSMVKTAFYEASISKELLLFVLAFLEVFRRFVWNIFRMENDHVNNCEAYRVTKDVPLPYDHEVVERGLEVGLMSSLSQQINN